MYGQLRLLCVVHINFKWTIFRFCTLLYSIVVQEAACLQNQEERAALVLLRHRVRDMLPLPPQGGQFTWWWGSEF
jgi:hypothetical protein